MNTNPIDKTTIEELISNNGKYLYAEESALVEFKSEFDWKDKEKRAKYCKSMAALCNNKGGYLIFGIEDETKNILGITDFDKVDPASISSHLNNYFSPSIAFHKTSVKETGKEIGIIYIEKHKEIPTICIKSFDNILKDGNIFYRYSGKSEVINGTDLISLLHQLKGGSSKELVDLKRVQLKQNALPIIKSHGGHSKEFNISVSLINEGKRAKINSIQILSGKLNFAQSREYPFMLETGLYSNISFLYSEKIPAAQVIYEIEILFEDGIGTKYRVKGRGAGPSLMLDEPKEIN